MDKWISTLQARVLNEGGAFMNAQKYTQKSLGAVQAAQALTIENQNQQICLLYTSELPAGGAVVGAVGHAGRGAG